MGEYPISDIKDRRTLPIGVFDSGLGGLSVLKELISEMPSEQFLYYGDSLNAPYGTKSMEEVRDLTICVAEKLLKLGVKAIVIACNTATGAAVKDIREKYPKLIVVSIEPAIKPACLFHRGKKVLAMATPLTLKQDKFNQLCGQFGEPDQVVKVPCDGLVEFIERGELEGKALTEYLTGRLRPYLDEKTGAVVLGCTHYPFIRKTLEKILPPGIEIYDGGGGTARQLKRRLEYEGLVRPEDSRGQICLMNSKEDHAAWITIEKDKTIVPAQNYEGLLGLSIQLLKSDIQ